MNVDIYSKKSGKSISNESLTGIKMISYKIKIIENISNVTLKPLSGKNIANLFYNISPALTNLSINKFNNFNRMNKTFNLFDPLTLKISQNT